MNKRRCHSVVAESQRALVLGLADGNVATGRAI